MWHPIQFSDKHLPLNKNISFYFYLDFEHKEALHIFHELDLLPEVSQRIQVIRNDDIFKSRDVSVKKQIADNHNCGHVCLNQVSI